MRWSLIVSAVVAVIVGFGGSVAVVLAAADAVGASAAARTSWVAALCLSMFATSLWLSLRHRMPIVTAWSTPGAALVASTTGVGMEEAAGAFIAAAVLLILTAAVRPLGELVRRIPTSLATAVLAGVLFSFLVEAVDRAAALPTLGLPMLLVFLAMRLWSPPWAVIGALVTGIAVALALGPLQPLQPFALPRPVLVSPIFDPAILLGLGLPLYIVTMASQNLPGFAVLRADGYTPPAPSILAATGLASLMTAPFGAHTTSLAAITAAICTGRDAHPDADKRWVGGVVYAVGYLVLAAAGASVIGLFASFPPELIAILAGVALTGPFIGALATSVSTAQDPFPGVVAFVVTASGLTTLGVGAAFWGLVAGLVLDGLERLHGRYAVRRTVSR